MKPYIFKVNKKSLETSNPILTGSQILQCAGLEPSDDYELLQRINEKGFEPIQLEEEVDLREVGIEGFTAKPYKRIPITIDGKTYEVEKCFMTPLEILALAGIAAQEFYLKEKRTGNIEIGYEDDSEHKIALSRKSVFFTCKIDIEFCLIVNAREKIWTKTSISYEESIVLAYGSISTDPNVAYTVNYKRGPKGSEDGSLVKGQKVYVQQKMVFNVSQTNKS